MKIIKSIVLAVGTLLLTLLIQFPAYVGITAFQENVLLKLAVMIGLGLQYWHYFLSSDEE